MRNALTVPMSVLLVTAVLGSGADSTIRVSAQEQSGHQMSKSSSTPNLRVTGLPVRFTKPSIASMGGQVLVLPGTYAETLTITKGLTLTMIGGNSGGDAIITPAEAPGSVIEIATDEPVTLRGLTVHVPGLTGIGGFGQVDVTIESSFVVAPDPVAAAQSNLVTVTNDLADGSRARLVIRDSVIDGRMTVTPVGQSFLVRAAGNIDALIERNVLRRAGGACIFIVTRADLGGETNADILTTISTSVIRSDVWPQSYIRGVRSISQVQPALSRQSARSALSATRFGTVSTSVWTVQSRMRCTPGASAQPHRRLRPALRRPKPEKSPGGRYLLDRPPFCFSVSAGDADRPIQRSPGERAGGPSDCSQSDDSNRCVLQLLGIGGRAVRRRGRRWIVGRRLESRRSRSCLHAFRHRADCRKQSDGMLNRSPHRRPGVRRIPTPGPSCCRPATSLLVEEEDVCRASVRHGKPDCHGYPGRHRLAVLPSRSESPLSDRLERRRGQSRRDSLHDLRARDRAIRPDDDVNHHGPEGW